MATARLGQKRKRRITNCIALFDQLACRSSKAQTQELLEISEEKRRRVERSREELRRKIDAVREVLLGDNVDEAKRYLENWDKTTLSNDHSISNPKFEHSAGSLLDAANVSDDLGSADVLEHINRRVSKARVSSAHKNIEETKNSPLRRSTRISKRQSSSIPKTAQHIDVRERPAAHNRLNRPHNFTSRSVLRLEVCSYCGQRIAFGKSAYKCTLCRLVVHSACRPKLIQTCLPTSLSRTPLSSFKRNTPSSSPKLPSRQQSHAKVGRQGAAAQQLALSPMRSAGWLNGRHLDLDISEFCPENQYPRIPALVIHCVTEVTARGLNSEGLYRLSGSQKHVRELLEKFLTSKASPVLARVQDIHVVCGCLKMFLRNLSEPLVTSNERSVLAAISGNMHLGDENALQHMVDVIDHLPSSNRDTLAYMMLHLKIVSRTPICRMSEEDLAKVMGPAVVGYSCPQPQVMEAVTETHTQQSVIRALFNVPDHIYSAILQRRPDFSDSVTTIDTLQNTYFSPVFMHSNGLVVQTPTPIRPNTTTTPCRTPGTSVRKLFFPIFPPNRDLSDA